MVRSQSSRSDLRHGTSASLRGPPPERQSQRDAGEQHGPVSALPRTMQMDVRRQPSGMSRDTTHNGRVRA
jgi:hypothetical protein